MAKNKNRKALGLGVKSILSGSSFNFESDDAKEKEKMVKTLANVVAALPVDQIETYSDQPRKKFDDELLQELSESIKVHGLIQPITVRRISQGKYQLISGERRLRATKMASLKEIPAYVRIANDQEMLEMALVENIQREDLNSIEIATTYQRLMDECKLTHEKLAGRLGKNRSSITNYLRLLKLPPSIQDAVKRKKLSMGHARALAGVKDIALQLSLFKQIIDQGLSVRQVEALTKEQPKSSKQKPGKPKLSFEYKKVQDNLKDYFNTKVNLKVQNSGKGQIVINFSNTADLNRILEILEE